MRRLASALVGFHILAMGLWPEDVLASENGQTHANLGYLDLLAGFEPPPGFYFRNDVIGVPSDRLSDRNGDRARLGGVLPVDFHSDAFVDIATVYYVSPVQIAGGNFATAVLVPFKNQNVSLGTPLTGTINSSVTGLGDIIVVPQLGWHLPQWNLHITVGPAFYTPTGQYSPTNPVGNNVGHNFLTVEPQINVTYLNKTGQEVSLAFTYDFNSANRATGYTSGDEFSVNYAIAQHLSQAWTIGVAGYYYRQLTNDVRNGNVVFGIGDQLAGHPDLFNNGRGNRGEVLSVGPVVEYNFGNKARFLLKWEHETFAVNKQRADQIWGRVSLPLAFGGKG